MDIKSFSTKEKIASLFITGYSGEDFQLCPNFVKLLKNGLGGVIFFTQNILTTEQFKEQINKINSMAKYPLLLSIDQEGGRVERTLNIHGGPKYQSAKYLAQRGNEFLTKQTKQMLEELKSYGINTNFAPVLDVNTNSQNPIIGERAYSDKSDEVIDCSKIVLKEYQRQRIIAVGKHFPGHGAASKDSHLTMPEIDLSEKEMRETHIKPFKIAIEQGLKMVMVAHVHYSAFDKEYIPASISQNVVKNILREELNFKGVVVSDDMVMGGISGINAFEACKRALEAGVNMFIYRDTTLDVLDLIDKLEEAYMSENLVREAIDNSLLKIIELKAEYML